MGMFSFGKKDNNAEELKEFENRLRLKEREVEQWKEKYENLEKKYKVLGQLIDGDEEMENINRVNYELYDLKLRFKKIQLENEELRIHANYN
jgi:uncharacterized protein (DUF342 family)